MGGWSLLHLKGFAQHLARSEMIMASGLEHLL